MGTASYVLTGKDNKTKKKKKKLTSPSLGTQKAMEETFGSTCHGAGRTMSRSAALRGLNANAVMRSLTDKGISVKVGSKHLIAEEAPESYLFVTVRYTFKFDDGRYKDVSEVVNTCHEAGISKLCVKLRPLAVIKG